MTRKGIIFFRSPSKIARVRMTVYVPVKESAVQNGKMRRVQNETMKNGRFLLPF